MTKVSLTKTPDEIRIEQEEAEQARMLEVQKERQDRQEKVAALHKKQKTMKIVIVAIIVIFAIAMLTFGTYNTFFKHVLDLGDVKTQVATQVNIFPTDGLDEYVRSNCQEMFNMYMTYDHNAYEYVYIDENSVYVSRVRPITNNLAEVWFCADVVMKEKDFEVTDPVILERLRNNGFGVTVPEEVTPMETVPAYTTWETTEEGLYIEPTTGWIFNTETGKVYVPNTEDQMTIEQANALFAEYGSLDAMPGEAIATAVAEAPETVEIAMIEVEAEPETTDDTTVEDDVIGGETETDTDDDVEMGSIEMANDRNSDAVEYYLVGNGRVYQRGQETTVRYTFYLPIEFYYTYDADGTTPVASGYRPAAALNMYELNEINQTEDFGNIAINARYSFENIAAVDDETFTSAKIKVDNILNALYSGRDTSQDFYNFRTFNTYGASYVRMVSFAMYSENNTMGYNVYCEYLIQTEQGFQYQVNAYMLVEPVGEGQSRTWKITAIT